MRAQDGQILQVKQSGAKQVLDVIISRLAVQTRCKRLVLMVTRLTSRL